MLLKLFILFLIAYLFYFFFVQHPKTFKVDHFSSTVGNDTLGTGKRWTHSQHVVDDEFDLKCVVSSVDGERYCVRNREKIQLAVDLVANVTNRLELFIRDLKAKYPTDKDVDRLFRNFDKRVVSEILPNSVFEAVTTNKGEEVEFCLTEGPKSDPSGQDNLIDEHTLTFVALHEVTHIMCHQEDHPPLFWEQFRFLLKEAEEMDYHTPVDYSVHPVKYCGREITESPYFHWKSTLSTEK